MPSHRLRSANRAPVYIPQVNALAQTINGLYKAGVNWRPRVWLTALAIEMATLRWADLLNNCRLFGPIRNIPPGKTEDN